MSTTIRTDDKAFATLRPRLFSIAYRMLGVLADAEDVVQDAWLRWHANDAAALQSADAWLVTVTTRLAIDRLRTRKSERESYIGWWLPEPLIELDERTPEGVAEMAGEVSMALLWVLERLAPDERAAFLMRQVFEHDYSDIAATLGKSEAACRQMVHRAQERVRQERPRFEVPKDTHKALLAQFIEAAKTGDRAAMKAMMASDVQLVVDGRGKANAFRHMLRGAGRIAGLYWAMNRWFPAQVVYRAAQINGEPGLVRYVEGKLESAQSFIWDEGCIVAVLMMRNPDKLTFVPQTI